MRLSSEVRGGLRDLRRSQPAISLPTLEESVDDIIDRHRAGGRFSAGAGDRPRHQRRRRDRHRRRPAGAAAAIRLAAPVIAPRSSNGVCCRARTRGDSSPPPFTSSRSWASTLTRSPRPNASIGIRLTGRGNHVEVDWPSHPVFPVRLVVRRDRLDELVADRWSPRSRRPRRLRAITPIVDGFVRGVVVRQRDGSTIEMRACYSSSPTAPTVGSTRSAPRENVPGRTPRRSATTPRRSDTPAIELTIDLTDRNGVSITGYGCVPSR
jgi:hypothetical protein